MIRPCACPAVVHVVAVVAAAAAVCQLTLVLVYCYHIHVLLLPFSAFLLLQLQPSDFVVVDAGLAVAAAVDPPAVLADLDEAVPAAYLAYIDSIAVAVVVSPVPVAAGAASQTQALVAAAENQMMVMHLNQWRHHVTLMCSVFLLLRLDVAVAASA